MTDVTFLASNLESRSYRSTDLRMTSERTSRRAFVGICASIFAASAALTIVWCASMSGMRGMPMPGGWTMSMMWMRMPGQTWIEATTSFLGMWVVMMAAMMLPSHAPLLWGYRQSLRAKGEGRPGRLTLLASLGYFAVWTFFGLAVFPLGLVLAMTEMQQPVLARAVPVAVGWSFLLPVRSSSRHGRHITWPAAVRRLGKAAHCWVMREVHGDRVCALDFVAASVVPI